MSGIFQTRAPARSPFTKFLAIDIPGGNTLVVDSVPVTDRMTAKWLVTLTNYATTEIQSYEVLGNYFIGKSIPSYTASALIGDRVKNKAEVILFGGELALEIENKETQTLHVDVCRFNMGT
jgi:hypothetical protein